MKKLGKDFVKSIFPVHYVIRKERAVKGHYIV